MELRQVVLCKQLFFEAERYLSGDNDVRHGLAVSISQDAVELFLRAVMKDIESHGPKPPDDFIKCMDYIDAMSDGIAAKKVPLRAKLLELNKARVNFKHYGLTPSRADALRLVGYAERFFELATPLFFSSNFSSISLADLISDSEVRDQLKVGESSLQAHLLDKTVKASAEAVQTSMESILASLKPLGEILGPTMPDAVHERLGAEVAGSLKAYIDASAASSKRVSLMLALAVNVRDLFRFECIAPQLKGGHRGHYVWRQPLNPEALTEDDAAFALRFATHFSLVVDGRMARIAAPALPDDSDPLSAPFCNLE